MACRLTNQPGVTEHDNIGSLCSSQGVRSSGDAENGYAENTSPAAMMNLARKFRCPIIMQNWTGGEAEKKGRYYIKGAGMTFAELKRIIETPSGNPNDKRKLIFIHELCADA